jgi:hypothetical protein
MALKVKPPTTAAGRFRFVCVPSPKSPDVFPPQQ